jgi:hypothetical protein
MWEATEDGERRRGAGGGRRDGKELTAATVAVVEAQRGLLFSLLPWQRGVLG